MVDFCSPSISWNNLQIQVSQFGPNSHYFSPAPLTPPLASSSLYAIGNMSDALELR